MYIVIKCNSHFVFQIWNHPDIYYEQAKAQKNQTAAASWKFLSDEGINLPPQMTSESACKLEWVSTVCRMEWNYWNRNMGM